MIRGVGVTERIISIVWLLRKCIKMGSFKLFTNGYLMKHPKRYLSLIQVHLIQFLENPDKMKHKLHKLQFFSFQFFAFPSNQTGSELKPSRPPPSPPPLMRRKSTENEQNVINKKKFQKLGKRT